jgi:alpha-tubulin suppressor-like RCC1 family protein
VVQLLEGQYNKSAPDCANLLYGSDESISTASQRLDFLRCDPAASDFRKVPLRPLRGRCGYWGTAEERAALKSDGTVWAWGENDYGQLGDGTTTSRAIPVQVSGVNKVVAIAARDYGIHNLAVKSDGTVWEWPTAERLTPVHVTGLSEVVAVADGLAHSLALKHDGSVWAWGRNLRGQLGVQTTVIRTTPVQVVGPATQ